MLPFSWQVLQAGPPKLWLRAPRCARNMKRKFAALFLQLLKP